MKTTTRTYRIQSLFSQITLTIAEKTCAIIKNGHTYDVARSEAANIIRYARAKGFASITK